MMCDFQDLGHRSIAVSFFISFLDHLLWEDIVNILFTTSCEILSHNHPPKPPLTHRHLETINAYYFQASKF